MTYDQERDVLWLLDQAAIDVAPSTDTGQGAKITAGTAGYARRDKYMRFDRGVRLLVRGHAPLLPVGARATYRPVHLTTPRPATRDARGVDGAVVTRARTWSPRVPGARGGSGPASLLAAGSAARRGAATGARPG